MTPLQVRLERWREYGRISKAGQIARRAFANNSFDGVLTMIGVVMGSFVVGVQESTVVLVTGLSTALAIGISGGWGAYLTESAERSHAVEELEQLTLTELRDTKIGKASRMAVVFVAAVDGLSPFLAALLVLIPFFLAPLLPSISYAYYASIGMALLALFGLGIYLGRISKRNLILSGVKTAVAGVICIALIYGLEQLAQ
ncbi:MAG TPA: VIT1/CCC1 transporter family protein [Anaerolineae bacterium]|nr:VIT1/CCC1 transporter family protein [Anaerolineae bacterium]